MTTARSRTVAPRTTTNRSPDHLNQVSLVGTLAGPPTDRVQAGGAEVTAFRIVVRAVDASGQVGAAERIDCAAGTPALRQRVSGLVEGDTIAVEGTLRHRYWRTPAGLADRYEVEVTSCARRGRTKRPAADPLAAPP